MKRFSRGTISLVASFAALSISLVPPALAHDGYDGSGSYSTWSFADTIEHKADYLRNVADRLQPSLVLDDEQADVLQARLRTAASRLDVLAAQYRAADSDAERQAVKDRYDAELAAVYPTLVKASLAFKGDGLRRYASSLAAKANYYDAALDSLVADNRIAAEDVTAVNAALSAARTKIRQARAWLDPSVLGEQVVADTSAARTTISRAGVRLGDASFWVRTAGAAISECKR